MKIAHIKSKWTNENNKYKVQVIILQKIETEWDIMLLMQLENTF